MTIGCVWLVGAGPGDPELITVKGHRLLHAADVVMYDALVDEAILERVAPSARVLDVGKRPGPSGERTTQDEINRLMVENASNGRDVVRLKGGDPTVFGRGGEEAAYLAEAGIPFEIVPGLSSAVAGPVLAGIPLTHRDIASTVTVIPGHEASRKETSALDWDAIANTLRHGGTLVVLMGVRTLPAIVERLHEREIPPETPAATIERASWSAERTVTGTLATIAAAARDASIEPPAVTVFGEVVAVRDRIGMCEDSTGQGVTDEADTQ